MNELIPVKVEVHSELDTEVHIGDVIYALNQIPMKERWNMVSKIFSEIQLDLTKLTDEQKLTVKEFLQNKLTLFD